jgi:hypothetical protein
MSDFSRRAIDGGNGMGREHEGSAAVGTDPGMNASADARRRYAAPRITKKRAVSRATLFTGSGPDTGGVVAA